MEKHVWKVLIADDEKKVCELIQYLVPWEELGLSVAAVVQNGLEAIEVIKREPIDIVITDARMPECDGIELIKWCHQQKRNLKYIVISGYRHFEYAHGALQYGVDYYLLKPINQKELVESLKEITEKLGKEETDYRNHLEVQRQMVQDRDKLRRHFIGSYIFDGSQFCNREIGSREEINEEYKTLFTEGIYRALLIKVDNVENFDYKIDKLLLKIQKLASAQMAKLGDEMIGTLIHSGLILLLNYQKEQEEQFILRTELLYEEMEKTLDIFEGLRLTFGVSCKENSLNGMYRCIQTAVEAVKYRVRLTSKGIIFYDDYQYRQVEPGQIFTEERRQLLEAHLKSGNQEGIKKLLFEMKLELRRIRDVSPAATFSIVQEAAAAARQVMEQEIPETCDNSMLTAFQEKVDRADREELLWQYLEEQLLSCVELLSSELMRKQTRPIRTVKEYIGEHYAEAITLEIVAEKVNLTANYISAMFRRETGVSFSDYLTAKRMEIAVDLLRKTDLSIGEVAERVGYSDVKYFSKLCKKVLGMKPSEYRKLYS